MSRISVNFTQVGASTPEVWRESEGQDLKTFLVDAQVNINKVSVYHNGSMIPTSQLCTVELKDGDSVKLTAANYSSGHKA